MGLTVTDLVLQLEAQARGGNGGRVVKFTATCPHCGEEVDQEIDTVEAGDDQFPDEVWIG